MVEIISLGMVNVFLIKGSKQHILIDTGMKNSQKKILQELSSIGIQPEQIGLIVLTHSHEDHIGSLKAMADLTDAQVVIHEKEYETIEKGNDEVRGITFAGKVVMGTAHRMMSRRDSVHGSSLPVKATIMTEDTFDLKSFGVEGRLVHTPGHTKGSLSVLMENGDAILGDSIMAMMPWSRPGKPIVGYDMKMTARSIRKLMTMGAKRFYLSHGKVYDKNTIQQALTRLEA